MILHLLTRELWEGKRSHVLWCYWDTIRSCGDRGTSHFKCWPLTLNETICLPWLEWQENNYNSVYFVGKIVGIICQNSRCLVGLFGGIVLQPWFFRFSNIVFDRCKQITAFCMCYQLYTNIIFQVRTYTIFKLAC